MKKIVVVGSLNMDLVSRVVTLPQEGETITGTSFSMHPGGKGANQAVAAGKLGADVEMIGALGDDAFADRLFAELAHAGVGAACIKRVQGTSGCATILVSETGSNCIVVTPGSNAQLDPEDLERASGMIEKAAVVLCQLETRLDTVLHLAEITARAGVPLVLDPAPMAVEPLPMELLQRVTWLTPNETETAGLLAQLGHAGLDLSSDKGLERAAAVLQSAGPRNVIIKRGDKGVYMSGLDCMASRIAAPKVTAVDTTAAGDAFNGGFAFALAQGKSPHAAAEFACTVAAFSVMSPGAQESMPSMDALNQWLLNASGSSR